jgi:RNA polymerase sigma-70 factor (ECF subfamily)
MQLQETHVSTDKELLELLRQDDSDAFAIIYKRYFNPLYGHAFKMLKDKAVCKDIVQEIFVQLWAKRHTQEINALDAYLHAITRFQVFKAIRSSRSHDDLFDIGDELPVCSGTTESIITQKEMAVLLYNSVIQLPQKCQAIFNMSRVDHLSTKEIALRLAIAPKTVENQLTIALRKLRVNFRDYLPALVVLVHCCYHKF